LARDKPLRLLAFWNWNVEEILKDHQFNSSNEIEEAITIKKVWNEFFFDEMQTVFDNWMSRLAWVIEDGESILLDRYEMVSSPVVNLKIGGGAWNSLYSLYNLAISHSLASRSDDSSARSAWRA
jgi:hypothetical protein